MNAERTKIHSLLESLLAWHVAAEALAAAHSLGFCMVYCQAKAEQANEQHDKKVTHGRVFSREG